ncbi:zinc-binding dehydrogenase [Streptomyces sp. NPDC059215]|uniref:zinc-binding dehydrogenase n=1 Tax=Streptomyces sp. NPDC059215 TaxID=3346772 RepID=UPI0036B67CA2
MEEHMNRRAVYSHGGTPSDVLRIIDGPDPGEPQRGQVRVRITAFPIHPGDLQAIEATSTEISSGDIAAGLEATGVVEAIGPDTPVGTGVKVGGRVTVFPHAGAWADWILADSTNVVAVPDGISDDIAAQLLVNPLTAIMLKREAEKHFAFGYGGLMVQTAAGSSVGRILSGAATIHSLPLINVVRSERGAELLRDRFSNIPAISTDRPGWVNDLRDIAADRPVSVALDPIGGRLAENLLDILAPGGTLINYGLIAQEPISVHASTILLKSLTLRGTSIGRWLADLSPERRASDVATAILIAYGLKDQFDVAGTYDFQDLGAAVDFAVKPGKVGTVLVRTQ